MIIRIQEIGHFGFMSTNEAFKGSISGSKQPEIGRIEYDNSSNKARLLITIGDDGIELTADGKYLAGTEGDLRINGEKRGWYDNRKFTRLHMSNRERMLLVQVEEDDSDRRFLWAYRLGETRGKAIAWSRSRYALLLGADYALASIMRPMARPIYFAPNMSFELMSNEDEEAFHRCSREEQLCILVCSCWWLCAHLHRVKSSEDPVSENWHRIAVPSTLRIGNRITFLPENLPRRNDKVEFLTTQPVFMWLWIACALVLGLVILPLCRGAFTIADIAFPVVATVIPVCWIVLCHTWHKSAYRRLKQLEEQLNTQKS